MLEDTIDFLEATPLSRGGARPMAVKVGISGDVLSMSKSVDK